MRNVHKLVLRHNVMQRKALRRIVNRPLASLMNSDNNFGMINFDNTSSNHLSLITTKLLMYCRSKSNDC